MLIHSQIRNEANALFLAGLLKTTPPQHDQQTWECAANDLLGLLAEFHDQPAQKLRSMIRRIVIERMYMNHTGDSMANPQMPSLDRQVDYIVSVLEQVRQHAVQRGQWSEQPAPPLMCG